MDHRHGNLPTGSSVGCRTELQTGIEVPGREVTLGRVFNVLKSAEIDDRLDGDHEGQGFTVSTTFEEIKFLVIPFLRPGLRSSTSLTPYIKGKIGLFSECQG